MLKILKTLFKITYKRIFSINGHICIGRDDNEVELG